MSTQTIEREFARRRDALSAKRRELPWVKVEMGYNFEGPKDRNEEGDDPDWIRYHDRYEDVPAKFS